MLSVHLHFGLCQLKSMGAEHRLFKQVLPRLQIPERLKCPTWMFILSKVTYVCFTPQNTVHRNKTISNTGCVITAPDFLHVSWFKESSSSSSEGTLAWLPNGHLIFYSSPYTLLFIKVFLLAGHTLRAAWWKPCWKTHICQRDSILQRRENNKTSAVRRLQHLF